MDTVVAVLQPVQAECHVPDPFTATAAVDPVGEAIMHHPLQNNLALPINMLARTK